MKKEETLHSCGKAKRDIYTNKAKCYLHFGCLNGWILEAEF